jgi:peroxiredoxin
MQEIMPEIEKYGATVVAISPQDVENSRKTAEEKGLSYPVLSDPGNEYAAKLGLKYEFSEELKWVYKETLGVDLAEYNAEDPWTLPVPATYVTDGTGEIVFSYVDADYTKRAEPKDILDAVESIVGEVNG